MPDRQLVRTGRLLLFEFVTYAARNPLVSPARDHVSDRTIRGQLRRAGLGREALAAEPKAYGRYEAARPNERWITDVLVGPWVPHPKREGSARARLFLIVDDHSRLLADGRFYAHENARAGQDLLRRAITRRGVPQVLYADYAGLRIMPNPARRACSPGVSGRKVSA